ncbi:GNAT family N-acetyltransferase [Micromonospora sp. NBC_01699]|uniref:GNAT family N-acetyltransferase n=1 Tax=Micromonospora sp. NBC_01699 TaxID=2975984 RepID=UPI002E2B3CBA|nr:GNAT family protein [Micromonospora sp. NBC_01699]
MFAIPLRDNAELRVLEPWYAEEFFTHLERARTHIAPWVGATFVASDLDGAREVLQRYADGQAVDRQRIYGIWLDGTLVGGTMFVSFNAASGVCEVGCWLEPAAEGHGLITQVVRLMIDWAFRVRGLSRAEWRTLPDNVRSVNVAKRLGMSLDGVLRQYSPAGEGRRKDQQYWSVLADEWPGAA